MAKESKAGAFLRYILQARDSVWQRELLLPACCREIAGGKMVCWKSQSLSSKTIEAIGRSTAVCIEILEMLASQAELIFQGCVYQGRWAEGMGGS